ncbi:MAG: hypothetical protein H6923_11165, partial [Alphaproteobacteria bacterium]|nr:hypothetical protein [Alphaproteobacteria bacterium]
MPPEEGEAKEDRPAPEMFYRNSPRKAEPKRRTNAVARTGAPPVKSSAGGLAWIGALVLEAAWLGGLVLLWWPITEGAALDLSYDNLFRFGFIGLFGTVLIFGSAALFAAARRSNVMAANLGRLSQRLTEPVGGAANEV